MKNPFLPILIVGAALFLFPTGVWAHSASSLEEVIIHMTDSGFEPKDITIEKGGTVIFENIGKDPHWPASNIHPTHTIYPGTDIRKCGTSEAGQMFDACRGIGPGESWEFTFNQSGVWRMHDHLYVEYGGVITVTGEPDKISILTDGVTKAKPSFLARIWNGIKDVWYWITHFGKSRPAFPQPTVSLDNVRSLDVPVTEDSEAIFTNDDALRSYIKKYGSNKTILALHNLEGKFGSCHQPAHRTGHLAYDILGDKAFIEYSAYCQSGYYHGAMERYFQKNGTADLTSALGGLCKSDLNYFFEHQCVHGIGHGIMAWVNYDLPEALKECDLLPRRQDSCWTGVFMENLGAQLLINKPVHDKDVATGETDTHYTKYLSDDPQYPCNAVEEKHQGSCYFLQTSRMIQILGADYKRIAEECAKAVGIYNQTSCFGSMGRDVGGTYPTDAAEELKACGYVSDKSHRIECLSGAVQNSFWDPSGQDFALSFCKLLTDTEEKNSCYGTIFGRAPQVISDKTELQIFCAKTEAAYQQSCFRNIRP